MKLVGVKDAKPDAKKKSVWVKYDPAKVTPKQMVDTINNKTNFKARLE